MSNVYDFSHHCCGCGECAALCPKQAITMQVNDQGFLHPVIDSSLCVQCGLCVQCCSFNNPDNLPFSEPLQFYAVKHKNPDIRARSRSGGIFTALSDWILSQNGAIYGCKLLNNRVAIHCRATTAKERDFFRGSKYIQSDTQSAFHLVKEDLQNGLWVLYSGTPCQTASLLEFCKDTDCTRLLLVDIVCHGVPSPKVWRDYLSYHEHQYNSSVSCVDFRDKNRFGWAAHKETIIFSDNNIHSGEDFKSLFYAHYIIRPSCFECPYKTLRRVSDITIADCWGIQEHYPHFNDNKGVSLVLVNTDKGRSIYDQLLDIEQIPVEIENVMQPCLRTNWPKPNNYEEFWRFYKHNSFKKVINRYVYCRPSYSRRLYNKIRRVFSRKNI